MILGQVLVALRHRTVAYRLSCGWQNQNCWEDTNLAFGISGLDWVHRLRLPKKLFFARKDKWTDLAEKTLEPNKRTCKTLRYIVFSLM